MIISNERIDDRILITWMIISNERIDDRPLIT